MHLVTKENKKEQILDFILFKGEDEDGWKCGKNVEGIWRRRKEKWQKRRMCKSNEEGMRREELERERERERDRGGGERRET